ncbi:MAG: hypothetical protein Q9160_005385 [Pyrenula sp. 1 TL-2023]
MIHFRVWATAVQAILFGHQALAVPYSEYILAPQSRTIRPASVYNVNGTVNNAEALTEGAGGSSASFEGASAVTYDFGLNTAGIVSFTVDSTSGSDEYIGVSFTESSLWINSEGCDASQDAGLDEALWFQVSTGTFSADKDHQRGGFRYMNVYHNTTGSVGISSLSIQFTAVPQLQEDQMANYTGYFHSNDDKLNRVWYAGAYTNQLCTIDPTAGDSLISLGQISSRSNVSEPLPWYVNYTISNTIRDSLNSLLDDQDPVTGQLPYAGRPFGQRLGSFSFTYHLYSLIDIADYYLYTGNLTYLSENWNRFKFGLNYSLSTIDDSGLMNVTSSADWLRFGMGGHNIEANSILYYTLNRALTLASALNDASVASNWTSTASTIKSAIQSRLWDSPSSLFRDNDTLPLTTLHPQDGNVWAILANTTDSPSQNSAISDALYARWTPYGPPAIEAADAISPFISGFEIQAHFLAGRTDRALQLIRYMWADFMLDDPRMTNSTFIEGYSSSGELHYAPYKNDPRISHAHGWATGPTSALTFYVAGLTIVDGGGSTWRMAPNPGDLTDVEAGFSTTLGAFSAKLQTTDGVLTNYNFSTPQGTKGSVSVLYPSCAGKMMVEETSGRCPTQTVDVEDGGQEGRIEVQGLDGGDWSVSFQCS